MKSDPDPGIAIGEALGLSLPVDKAADRITGAFVGRYGGQNALQMRFRATAADTSALLIAPTASGKTEAAAMAALDITYRTSRRILYVAPTRALINDIVLRLEPGFDALSLVLIGRHGEMHASSAREAEAKCIVTTPESLDAAFQRRPKWLDELGVVIIDELHVLDGTPRGAQLRVLLTRLSERAQSSVRVLAMSATVASPLAMAAWWGEESAPLAPVVARGGRSRDFDIALGGDGELRRWLSDGDAPAKVLIFTNSRRRSDEVFSRLDGASDRVLLVHYSSLESAYRKDVEFALRKLERVACVATSTLELGIDIGDIGAVALADAPWSSLSLTQRLGRAGRRDDSLTGRAFVEDDRAFVRLLACAHQTSEESDDDGVTPIHYSVGVQQAISLVGASTRGRVASGDLERAIKGIGVTRAAVDLIMAEMVDAGLLAPAQPTGSYQLTVPAERLLGGDQWSNFPEDRARWELSVAGRRMARIGLPGRPEAGQVLRFAGRYWSVGRVERSVVHVKPTSPVPSPIEAVYGSTVPMVPAATAAMMRQVLVGDFQDRTSLAETAARRLDYLRSEMAPTLTDGSPVLIREDGTHRVLTFAGTRANLLLMVSTGADEADDIGVTYSGRAPRSFDVDMAAHLAKAESAYAVLARYLPITRWFEFLPEPLRRAEVMSWVTGPGVEEAIITTIRRPLLPFAPSTPVEL